MAETDTVVVTTPSEGVALVTLNNPERMNSLTLETLDRLEAVARELDADASLRAVVVTGSGRAFCSGLDLSVLGTLSGNPTPLQLRLQERAVRPFVAVRDVHVPVIAAVNGPAVGAGISLALAADIRLAGSAAAFVAGFTRIGLSAGDLGVSWLLPRAIGYGAAAELVFTGGQLDATESARLGLVNRVVDGDVVAAAVELAARIAANSPSAVRLSKSALKANLEIPSYAAAIELENRGQVLATRTEDMAEAIAAFREKRDAVFTDR
ncbi:enoyl-CoA hydratase/isomerase family protein [Gryllotalpicola protaetiae]|uniref:Enoyl-CoA hydratase/isomerase family protein n=1 Tax=Gryllotalpicola protaetiae TaxID=2419771 RepID=A0A387BF85_9MICO|nr:enoyl-CoA hydratase-related protein [Gryllotalpicola protaetiae]AYG02655.1 enoyl-CoA hydratase/isomerase family protein [Gryllotalpicola protaetiae]